MTIGKKLYLSFGVILLTVLVLLAINMYGVHREQQTKDAAQRSIDMTEATSLVRFQMMQNRLHLQNYLLSGDTRDVEKMTEGERLLNDALHHAQELSRSAQQKSNLEKVQGLEQSWAADFANPLVDKRRAVDSGNATVAELQIFYLQKDPNSWVTRSSDVLDEVDRENRQLLAVTAGGRQVGGKLHGSVCDTQHSIRDRPRHPDCLPDRYGYHGIAGPSDPRS